jgi:hypothetical protein
MSWNESCRNLLGEPDSQWQLEKFPRCSTSAGTPSLCRHVDISCIRSCQQPIAAHPGGSAVGGNSHRSALQQQRSMLAAAT